MSTELNNRFEQGNGPRIFELRETLTSLHQGDDSLSSYFTKSMWDEIKELRSRIPYTCVASANNLDHHNQDQVLLFLTGLNKSFHVVREQILLNDPFPNLSKVLSIVIQEEIKRKLGHPHTTIATAHIPRPSNNPKPTNTNPINPNPSYPSSTNPNSRNYKIRPICTHFNKPGHLKEKCYFIHGFPPANVTQRSTTEAPKDLILTT
ncbi:uncharacterized protein LOC133784868 [Humulus lupulus]|uniref:uncharacterized protein LOC133784868 n=1 Tax=Humulus lupulus TaxID=3486 RepID=UPI002B4089D9|nr:uncharacterized protein LOC133784868 [Humulus lupulus]